MVCHRPSHSCSMTGMWTWPLCPSRPCSDVPIFASSRGIGADGPVDSVLFVAETPPEQWRRLLLDGESRTSAMLSRLLVAGPLADRLRDDLVIEEIPPGTGVERAGGDVASLVIGDAARALPDRLGVRIDLAETWKTWTGLPFVLSLIHI